MGIIRDQFQGDTFLPGSGVVLSVSPRPITLDDNGKYIVYALPGEWALPAWEDLPAGFSFQLGVVQSITGTCPTWDGSPWYYENPDAWWQITPGSPNDVIISCGKWTQGLLRPGMAYRDSDFDTHTRIYRTDIPNTWVIRHNDTSNSRGVPLNPVQARASVLSDGYFQAQLSNSNYIYSWALVCDENGQPDPLERQLAYATYGGGSTFIAGPDGVSGGPLLPFYIHVTNTGGAACVANPAYPTALGLSVRCFCPPNTFDDCNWAMFEEGGPMWSDIPYSSPILGTGWSIPSGQSLTFYVGNGGTGTVYGGNFGRNCYLRTAPGESTPRTWAQALALGPM